MLKGPISRALVLAGACLLAIAPFFWWGNPSGHDFEFHMYSWMEVLGQWKHGIVYPRWAALGYWGYGEARFLFYPPSSWTLGAALGAVLPWKMVPGAYSWIVLMLAGAAMYRLAREWLSAPDALFAAAFYALNPYHLLIVYWRSAYAKLLASALLPLLLLCVRLTKQGSRPVLWLADAGCGLADKRTRGRHDSLLGGWTGCGLGSDGAIMASAVANSARHRTRRGIGVVLFDSRGLRNAMDQYWRGAVAGRAPAGQFSFHHSRRCRSQPFQSAGFDRGAR